MTTLNLKETAQKLSTSSLCMFGTLQLTTIVRCPRTNPSKPGHTNSYCIFHNIQYVMYLIHDDYSHPQTNQSVYGLIELQDEVRDSTRSRSGKISGSLCHHQFCNVKWSPIQELIILRIAHQMLIYCWSPKILESFTD